jgi:hypothetical protein
MLKLAGVAAEVMVTRGDESIDPTAARMVDWTEGKGRTWRYLPPPIQSGPI